MHHIHHIIPSHAGGTDDPSNLVKLSVDEHAAAHKLLWETHGREGDKIAYQALSGMIGKEEIIAAACLLGAKKGGAAAVESGQLRAAGAKQPREARVKIGKKLAEWNTNNRKKNTGNRKVSTTALYEAEFIFHQYERVTERTLGEYQRSVVKQAGDTLASIEEETGIHPSRAAQLVKGERGNSKGWVCSCALPPEGAVSPVWLGMLMGKFLYKVV